MVPEDHNGVGGEADDEGPHNQQGQLQRATSRPLNPGEIVLSGGRTMRDEDPSLANPNAVEVTDASIVCPSNST